MAPQGPTTALSSCTPYTQTVTVTITPSVPTSLYQTFSPGFTPTAGQCSYPAAITVTLTVGVTPTHQPAPSTSSSAFSPFSSPFGPSISDVVSSTTRTSIPVTLYPPSTTSLVPMPTSGVTCPGSNGDFYTSLNGDIFEIECAIDRYDNDLATAYADTFDHCMNICSSFQGCVSVSYHPGTPGPCYLKGANTGNLNPDTNVWGAHMIIKAGDAVPTSTPEPTVTMTQTQTTTAVSTVRTTSFTTPTSTTTTSTITTSATSTSSAIYDSVIPNPFPGCGGLNHRNSLFLLRTHVYFGAPEFDGLYIQGTQLGAPASVPLLSRNRTSAAQGYYDMSTSSLAFWHGECDFSGLTMVLDHDMDEKGPVFINDQVGTARMAIDNNNLYWKNDRFGGWMVCKAGDQYELFYWDVITNMGVDTSQCAKVQLLLENL
ncbi:hypothetical protein K402DRAFT_406892 [Aulographum hederae CBS 113979]|uniref:Apple domain-containing protein n=1 Tax=Aulographum hederae CBS 113979 TaxID=1176131 RepID=A0A6G1GRN4_9PEZI|nr:hypothetical protein K402DRAFT_406892 [Aulographum hederae CBS 113979]